MEMVIFLNILSYMIGLGVQSKLQSYYSYIDSAYIDSEGYNYLYPISNCYKAICMVLYTLFCIILTCLGMGYVVRKYSHKYTGKRLEPMFMTLVGGTIMVFATSYLYGYIIIFCSSVIEFGYKNSEYFSILLAFGFLSIINGIMGMLSKRFDTAYFIKE